MLSWGALTGTRNNILQLFWSITFNRQNFPLIVRWFCSFFLSVLKTDIFVLFWMLSDNFFIKEKNPLKQLSEPITVLQVNPNGTTLFYQNVSCCYYSYLKSFCPLQRVGRKRKKINIKKTTRYLFYFLVMMRKIHS